MYTACTIGIHEINCYDFAACMCMCGCMYVCMCVCMNECVNGDFALFRDEQNKGYSLRSVLVIVQGILVEVVTRFSCAQVLDPIPTD